MQDTRTRTFVTTPTYRSGKRDNLKIRLYPRMFLSMGLAMVIATEGLVGYKIVNADKKDAKGADKGIESQSNMRYEERDIEAIQKIIDEHGDDMLYTKERISYEIKTDDDILSNIALKYGTTVNELKKINKGKLTPKGGTYIGSTILVDVKKPLSEEDAKINMLEAYIFDYALKESSFAHIASGEGEFKEQNKLYYYTLYGNVEDENTLDNDSIMGIAVRANAKYNEGEKSAEVKSKYIQILESICDTMNVEINNIGGWLLPYNEVETYFKNGTTKDIQREYTPYGDIIIK